MTRQHPKQRRARQRVRKPAAMAAQHQVRHRSLPVAYWLVTLSAVAASFWVGFHLPISNHQSRAPEIVRGSLPPTASLAAGVGRLSQAASNQWALEVAAAEARTQQAQFEVPPAFRGKTIQRVTVPDDRKVIALTFDDGPWPESTNAILYILRQHNVRATFFLLGRNVRNYPDRARQIVEHGHAVANHSWSHPYHRHSPAAAAAEIDNTDTWIMRATGVRSQLFRPPGGYLHTGLAAYAAGKGQVVVMWSIDSKDYYASSTSIANNVIRHASPGGIVLLHDGGGDRHRTIDALPRIINTLRQQGYEFITVPQLLELQQEQLQAAKG